MILSHILLCLLLLFYESESLDSENDLLCPFRPFLCGYKNQHRCEVAMRRRHTNRRCIAGGVPFGIRRIDIRPAKFTILQCMWRGGQWKNAENSWRLCRVGIRIPYFDGEPPFTLLHDIFPIEGFSRFAENRSVAVQLLHSSELS